MSISYTGAELAADTTAADSGNQTAGSSNGLFYFVFPKSEAVTSVTFSSSGNSLEVAGVSVSSIPEPLTWAMLALGFAGLGYAASRRNAKGRAIAI
jgi:PEP-CTERM motif